MKETHIEFDMDGRSHAGYVCEPAPHEGRLWPGVLVFHGGGGLGAHERERAHRLANLGYLAFAPDLFGEAIQSREQGMALINSLRSDTKLLRSRVYAALAQLCANPGVDSKRLAAIGFCLGGMCALELARSGAPLRAAISFHGGLTTGAPAEEGAVRAALLVCHGAADPFVTREHLAGFEAEMTRARADWQTQVYADAMHSFTERPVEGRPARPGLAYNEAADRRSWAAMKLLLEEVFI
ncbi:MAG TPA: dienelactone hydrolase family protein [Polyangiaceae bacterium]|nr:dienelactone hydrolase family protein [Polyangiaceae bacterium]